MAIYSRFGGQCEVVRQATMADVKTFERRRATKQDRQRTEDGCRLVMRWRTNEEDHGKEFYADTAYLRADGGFAEILSAVQAIVLANQTEFRP